jgi:hypothetical protein
MGWFSNRQCLAIFASSRLSLFKKRKLDEEQKDSEDSEAEASGLESTEAAEKPAQPRPLLQDWFQARAAR